MPACADPRVASLRGVISLTRISDHDDRTERSRWPEYAWNVTAEVRPNAVWRCGRLFLRCPRCTGRVTRVYLPTTDADPRCRLCWGLSYESRSWSYKPCGLLGPFLGPVAYVTTGVRRDERMAVSRARYAARQARRA